MNLLKRIYLLGLFCLALILCACGGGGSSSSESTSSTSNVPVTVSLTSSPTGATIGNSNVVALYMDSGPGGNGSTNIIYADVQVCLPSTSNCTVVNHVLVDTGSTGLRLLASALPSSFLTGSSSLPQVLSGTSPVGECTTFVSGFTWGGIRRVDLHLGGSNYSGEIAANIPAQIIADPASQLATIPLSCIQAAGYTGSSTNQSAISTFETTHEMQTAAQLGANGIIGIGLFKYDCGTNCASTASYVYQQCASTSNCNSISLPVTSQPSNPIRSFTSDTNGSTIILPTLPSGYADKVSGLLVMGIGTQSNNALASGSSVIGALPYNFSRAGSFTATFNGSSNLRGSYFDSGTTWNYFPATGTINYPYCSGNTSYPLCPTSPTTQLATLSGTGGTAGTINVFTSNVTSILALDSSANAMQGLSGGDSTSATFNLVLGGSSFFGRSIATLIENQTATGMGTGPAFGYTP